MVSVGSLTTASRTVIWRSHFPQTKVMVGIAWVLRRHMLLLRSQLQGGARPESSERLPADEAYLQVWVQLEPRMMT